jgi:S-DNA-T family DNA segregation ATPase FtsK/SpoIIIE
VSDNQLLSARDVHLAVPRPIEIPPRPPFPLLASLAPVVGSVVIWAVTSSPFALVFAFLGPVIAVAGLADSRLQARRTGRRERARLRTEGTAFARAVAVEHDRERAELRRRTPGAIAMLTAAQRDPERWRGTLAEPVLVSLGSGRVPSRLRVDGSADGNEEIAAVLADAAVLERAPITVDARLGIGICGVRSTAAAIARGLVLQLANQLPPEQVEWMIPAHLPEWFDRLPHATIRAPATGDMVSVQIQDKGDGCTILIAIARVASELPHSCRVVLTMTGGATAIITDHPSPEVREEVRPEFVSIEQADAVAQLLARAALGRAEQFRPDVPEHIDLADLADLADQSDIRRQRGLSARFLVERDGPIELDLVAAGPHAVVAGMTGSGKSELLVSWLLAIATRFGPDSVVFLLVDFKGGSAFAPIENLPHVVGLVTDLDERSAHRALLSLRAEVRHRERFIANNAVRSIDDLDSGMLPRLVIVVDEFAALVGGFAELHDLFADLAARGRSLGIHLVLCTQRPAGVVRDSVLANVPLRISLRVNNRADSIAVIGTDAAAVLPAEPRGRALLSLGGDPPRLTQVAIAGAGDAAAVIDRFATADPPRRPWRAELPRIVRTAELSRFDEADGTEAAGSFEAGGPALAFGVLDLPDRQRQEVAIWNPERDGNLLVLGATAAGKSTMLRALDPTGMSIVPAGIESAWDAVVAVLAEVRRGEVSRGLLLLDDLDAIVARLGDDHEQAFIDMTVELLRAGGDAGLAVVCTARRTTGRLQQIAAACDARLLLRLADRQEHLLAGGDPLLFASDAPSGRGEWRGAAVQIAVEEAPDETGGEKIAEPSRANPTRVFDVDDWPVVLAVSGNPSRLARLLSGSGIPSSAIERLRADAPAAGLGIRAVRDPLIVVGDPESWHREWLRLTTLRPDAAMLFDSCTIADYRALSGQRTLPPPIADPRATGWLLEPGGTVLRVRLPTMSSGSAAQ